MDQNAVTKIILAESPYFLSSFTVDSGTIGEKLPLDAINPAHRSLLRLNSPSHGIFSLFLNFQLMAQQLVL